jgi:hypothetical protein
LNCTVISDVCDVITISSDAQVVAMCLSHNAILEYKITGNQTPVSHFFHDGEQQCHDAYLLVIDYHLHIARKLRDLLLAPAA